MFDCIFHMTIHAPGAVLWYDYQGHFCVRIIFMQWLLSYFISWNYKKNNLKKYSSWTDFVLRTQEMFNCRVKYSFKDVVSHDLDVGKIMASKYQVESMNKSLS